MDIPVLLERVAGNGYRARAMEPLGLTAEAPTRDEALQKLRDLIAERLAAGAELVRLEVPGSEHPLARFAGRLPDDPLVEAWEEAMAEYRRQMDEDPDVP
jgi:predicted RNase H-like HicB family nuclease